VNRVTRLLIVDDSPAVCAALRALVTGAGPGSAPGAGPGSAPGAAIDVVGTATDGEDAIAQAVALRPDVVTMDLMMAGVDGIACIERLMLVAPTRIIAVTAVEPTGTAAMRALAAGALEVVGKPASWTDDAAIRTWGRRLAETIALMGDVPVVTRRAGAARPLAGHAIGAIGIAASTGGPPVLAEILRPLRGRRFPPILIAQHLGQGFTDGLVRWLREVTGIPAVTGSSGAALAAGTLYFAPDLRDLVIEGERLEVPPVEGLCQPCADRMFASMAAAFGRRALGIVLTGMGEDGAAGLRAIRSAGGVAIAQEPKTCLLAGMPSAAIAAGAAELVLEPQAIAAGLFGISRAP
jgi:two-component system chemotaxis response regulator CheB